MSLASSRLAAPALVLTGMLAASVSAALATPLFSSVGPLGVSWIRICWAALLLPPLIWARSREMPERSLGLVVALGVVHAAMIMCYFGAISLLPLGTTAAIMFLGPLLLAVWSIRSPRVLVWPVLALIGVYVLTQPASSGPVSRTGVLLAAATGVFWALNIVVTRHAAKQPGGLTLLAWSMPVAAVVAAVPAIPQAQGGVTLQLLLFVGLLALLAPVLTLVSHMQALKSLSPSTFGMFMCLEPAVGSIVGWVLLGQAATWTQAAGIALILISAMAVERQRWRALDREAETPSASPTLTAHIEGGRMPGASPDS